VEEGKLPVDPIVLKACSAVVTFVIGWVAVIVVVVLVVVVVLGRAEAAPVVLVEGLL